MNLIWLGSCLSKLADPNHDCSYCNAVQEFDGVSYVHAGGSIFQCWCCYWSYWLLRRMLLLVERSLFLWWFSATLLGISPPRMWWTSYSASYVRQLTEEMNTIAGSRLFSCWGKEFWHGGQYCWDEWLFRRSIWDLFDCWRWCKFSSVVVWEHESFLWKCLLISWIFRSLIWIL